MDIKLKKTEVSYNPNDGSYDIRASFVPNQWGFFADMPFLYLLAAEKLRQDSTPNKKKTSIFNLIKIGKQVEVKRTEKTKEFDLILKQMSSIKYNVASAILKDKTLKYNTTLLGIVNNIPIKGFQSIYFPNPEDIKEPGLENEKEQKEKLDNISEISKFNAYLLLNAKKDENGPVLSGLKGRVPGVVTSLTGIETMPGIRYADVDLTDTNISNAKINVLKRIDSNIDKITEEIKRRTYQATKTQLRKITISEIFSQIAKDAGLILGHILEAGIKGYNENKDIRRANRKILIGNSFPLIINKDKEEVPATKLELETVEGSSDVGVDNFEMKFVDQFIEAITAGIARNLGDSDDIGESSSVLKKRINNLEILQDNPYKPYVGSIITNVLIRSGIAAYLTRSNDPNLPGDYGKGKSTDRDGDEDNIIDLANEDSENITSEMLGDMSDDERDSLKRFVTFFDKLLSSDGDDFLVANGEKYGKGVFYPTFLTVSKLNSGFNVGKEPVNEEILNYPVIMNLGKLDPDDYNISTIEGLSNFNKAIDSGELKYGDNVLTLKHIIYNYIPQQTLNTTTSPDKTNEPSELTFVNIKTLTSPRVMNNGLPFFVPNRQPDKYYMVMFEGSDVIKLEEKNSSITDTEFQDEDKDVGSGNLGLKFQPEPLGIVKIDKLEDEEGDILERIKTINKYIEAKRVLSYTSLKNPPNNIYNFTGSTEEFGDIFLWTKRVGEGSEDAKPENLAFTVYTHQDNRYQGDDLVFGPFVIGPKGRNQRVYIKQMCKNIKLKIEKIEEERSRVIGRVLGKAGNERNLIYKQMHTIFHQWNSVASTIQTETGLTHTKGYICNVENMTGEGLPEALEKLYGGHHIEGGANDNFANLSNGTFVYDYPLRNINQNLEKEKEDPIYVKDSIINIEPLYKPNANTTVLNMIQQLCTKNNFVFVPFPGDSQANNIKDIFKPYTTYGLQIHPVNYFHVIFTPTPETRSKLSNDDPATLMDFGKQNEFDVNAIDIKFGSVENQIVKNISVGTEDTKPTAESIINLQRLVDDENTNKTVTTDCSMLPVLEGRSYRATCDIIGNAQVYPMQYFFLSSMPLFGGLYQIMKVKHSITPNNMETNFEGIRMRFSVEGGYGGIPPITLGYLKDLGPVAAPIANEAGYTAEDKANLIAYNDAGPREEFRKKINVETLIQLMKSKGYEIREKENKNYNLNIVGLRQGLSQKNLFDDFIAVFWKYGGEWILKTYPVTTTPGNYYLRSPITSQGTAIMKEGQYKSSYYLNFHKGYEALKQKGAIYFYRDNTKDDKLNLNEENIVYEIIAANIHRASPSHKSTYVDKWSAGCQVFSSPSDFAQFISIIKLAIKNWGNTFTYTLMNEADYVALLK